MKITPYIGPSHQLTGPASARPAAPSKADNSDVQETFEQEQAPAPPRRKRQVRKALLDTAGVFMGGYNAVLNIPKGVVVGAAAVKGKSDEAIRKRAANSFAIASTIAGGAIGFVLGGPFGLIGGAASGLISGTISNHLEARSGSMDPFLNQIADSARQSAGIDPEDENQHDPNAWQVFKGAVAGGVKGLTAGFKKSFLNSKIAAAGAADGIEFVVQNRRPPVSKKVTAMGGGAIKTALKAAAGTLFGLAGVLINVPGGAITGALQSLSDTDGKSSAPEAMTKTLMFVGTNVGKLMPSTAAGSVGGTAGYAVGAATGSITSIIDGRDGFHKGIVRQVDLALKEAHGEDEAKGNLRAYYRAGKGAVVGAVTGLYEGWRIGYEAGVENMSAIFDLQKQALDVQTGEEKKSEQKKAD